MTDNFICRGQEPDLEMKLPEKQMFNSHGDTQKHFKHLNYLCEKFHEFIPFLDATSKASVILVLKSLYIVPVSKIHHPCYFSQL